MQVVHFQTDTSGPVRFFCTSDGRIDFFELGQEFRLDPTSILLNGTRVPKTGVTELKSEGKWEQIEKLFKEDGLPVGTRDDPVKVTGEAPVHAVSTGQSYQPVQPGTQLQKDFWQSLPKAELKEKMVSINQDAHMEAEEIPVDPDADMEAEEIPVDPDADMEAEEIPVDQVTVTILELQDKSTFMGVEKGGRSSIMVPKFYDDLWGIAERLIDQRTGPTRMLITGTPGTGKSVMGWYFIYKLRMKLGWFHLVYTHELSGEQTLYSKDGTVTSAPTNSDSFSLELASADTVYVVDGAGALARNAMTFIFISPNPKAYKEIWKALGTKLYYSKIWSKIDILAARQLLYKDIDESLVLKLYKKWGGVPRHVLERANDDGWQCRLNTYSKSVTIAGLLDFVTKVGGQGRTENMSDVILHYRTEDYVQSTVVFVSHFVSELAYAALKNSEWAQTIQFLKRDDSTSAGFRGQLFEMSAHKMLVRECHVRIRSLEGKGQSKIETLDWPQLQNWRFMNVQDVKEGYAGCYWCPISKTNPAFDAVCTSIGAALGTSAALQMTISKKHNIKHDGLLKLLQAVPSVKRLYFVVPPWIFNNFRKQTFVNKDSQLRQQPISPLVSGVEQWALELDLPYSLEPHAEPVQP